MRAAVAVFAAAVILAGCATRVVSDVDEGEANQILAALQQRGLAGKKVRTSEGNRVAYAIDVGSGDATGAWQALREENLPRPRAPGVSEIFGKPGLVPTATQERALFHHAVAGELARTLQSVEGVLEARVHVVLPSRDLLAPPDAPAPQPRASVLLRVAGSPPITREEVQRLVAGSVDGLRTDAVTVVIAGGQQRQVAAGAPVVGLGPFQVAPGSRGVLRAVLVGGLALILLLCLALLLVVRRYRTRLAARAQSSAAEPRAAGTRPTDLDASLGLMSRSLGRSVRAPATGAEGSRTPRS